MGIILILLQNLALKKGLMFLMKNFIFFNSSWNMYLHVSDCLVTDLFQNTKTMIISVLFCYSKHE